MTNKLPLPTPASAHLRLAEAIIAPAPGLTRAPRRVDPMPDLADDPDCEGHADGPVMGETFYCDGSCS